MYKWIFLFLLAGVTALYFTGALDFKIDSDEVDISIDKAKSKELAESIRDKVAE